jgi:two-component system, cell cycle response regulator
MGSGDSTERAEFLMIGKVLIVDDVSTNRILFKGKLSQAGYETVLAIDANGCLDLARRERPDLILLSFGLPDQSALKLLGWLRGEAVTRRTPIVVFASEATADCRMAALRAGADDFLMRPMDDQTFLARLRNLMRFKGEPQAAAFAELAEAPALFDGPGLVAIVTARPETAMRLRDRLKPFSRDRFVPLTPDTVFDGSLRPDVYLIASDVSGVDSGLRLMSDLQSRPASRHAACCMLYDHIPPVAAAMAYDLGAQDLVDADVPPAELALRLTLMVRAKRQADQTRAKVQDGLRLAMVDPLTGLHNRRYAMATLQTMARSAEKTGSSLAVMLVDLDRFKSVNDRFGHAAGDAVLVEVSRRLSENLRAEDLLARVGGEEFLVVLPDATMDMAETVAARLCAVMKERPVALPSGLGIEITASIGLAMAHPGATFGTAPIQDIIERADVALLAAKSAGRNQVTVSRSAA